MSVKFNVKLTAQDMFRFHIYHAYTSVQGILSLVLAAFIIGVIVVSDDFNTIASAFPYIIMAVVFVFYIPISLRFRSKRQVESSEVLSQVLHFELTDEGVKVSVDKNKESATLPWDMVYKAVTTKHNLLVFSSRVNAYVIPKNQVEDQLEDIYQAFEQKCPDYRLHLKR